MENNAWSDDSSNQLWLDACAGAWQNQAEPVERYISSGGNIMRRLLDGEVVILRARVPGGFFSAGLDLINISLQADSQEVFRVLLPKDAMDTIAPPDPRQQLQQAWFEACKACQHSDLEPVRHFFNLGGTPSRRLLGSEARELCRQMPDCFSEGETLANLALKWDNITVLTFVLDAAEAPVERSGGGDGGGGAAASRREEKEEAGAGSGHGGHSGGNGVWDVVDSSAASSTHGAVSNAHSTHGNHGCGFRESAYRHVDVNSHADFSDTDMPYIAADNGAARRDEASRLGMQRMWLHACRGAYTNASNPIVAYLESGGDVNRRLTNYEMEALRMPGCFTVGERLAEIALRRDSGQALASIVTDMGGDLSDAGDLVPGVPPPKRMCSRRIIMEDYDAVSTDVFPSAVGEGGSWDHVWLDAIIGVVAGQDEKVLAYIESGGDLNRRVCAEEVSVLSHDNSRIITPGMLLARDTLVDICLRFQREEILKALCPNEVPQGAVKRLPSHLFPMEASSITKEMSASLEASMKGSYDPRALGYLQLNFAVPCEIRSFSEEARHTIMTEIVDIDARDTLEDEREPVINWCPALQAHSRLYPLYNGGLGDCLLHSTLQAAAGVEDPVMSLRSSLFTIMKSLDLYPRWKEARAREAFHDGFHADEWQWRKEWADLVRVASVPKTALEQTHVWALAHVLRRPIIVYAILNIRNYRHEVVDLARHQGIYLPLMLDKRDCSSNPLALAYIRGHYLGLVGEEKEQTAGTTILLPVMSSDRKLLPVHFLSDLDHGSEAAMIREWFCCRQVDGVTCVEQHCPARSDRPQPCQALVNRYAQDLRERFLTQPVLVGDALGGASKPEKVGGGGVEDGVQRTIGVTTPEGWVSFH